MCSGPNSTRARNFLTITRQVFWLIPIARLGAFPPKNGSDRKFREFGKRHVMGKIQQRVLPRILTCVPFSASSGADAHAGHHIITAQNYKLFPDSPNKSYLGQKRNFFYESHATPSRVEWEEEVCPREPLPRPEVAGCGWEVR